MSIKRNKYQCNKCDNVIVNEIEIKTGKLVCQFCKTSTIIQPDEKIYILQDTTNDTLPEWLKLYKYDDTVGDYIIYNDKKIMIKDL